VDDIWVKYDKDNNGVLDREESRKFVIETMGSLQADGKFSDDHFDKLFI